MSEHWLLSICVGNEYILLAFLSDDVKFKIYHYIQSAKTIRIFSTCNSAVVYLFLKLRNMDIVDFHKHPYENDNCNCCDYISITNSVCARLLECTYDSKAEQVVREVLKYFWVDRYCLNQNVLVFV